jgi:hypothetical protein
VERNVTISFSQSPERATATRGRVPLVIIIIIISSSSSSSSSINLLVRVAYYSHPYSTGVKNGETIASSPRIFS